MNTPSLKQNCIRGREAKSHSVYWCALFRILERFADGESEGRELAFHD